MAAHDSLPSHTELQHSSAAEVLKTVVLDTAVGHALAVLPAIREMSADPLEGGDYRRFAQTEPRRGQSPSSRSARVHRFLQRGPRPSMPNALRVQGGEHVQHRVLTEIQAVVVGHGNGVDAGSLEDGGIFVVRSELEGLVGKMEWHPVTYHAFEVAEAPVGLAE